MTIPVYFHVVYHEYKTGTTSYKYHYIPTSDLRVIVANLNKQFAAFKPQFRFVYKATTYKKYLDDTKLAAEAFIPTPL